jgi:two-component system NarL family sensor kinase
MSERATSPSRARRPGVLVAIVAVGWATALAVSILGIVLLPRLLADPTASGQVVATDWVAPITALTVCVMGGLVLLGDRAHPYGWLLFATGLCKVVEAGSGATAVYALEVVTDADTLGMVTAWLNDVLTSVGFALVVLLLPSLFPDGRAVAGRWGTALRLTLGSWIAYAVVFTVADRPLEGWLYGLPGAPANPTGILALPLGALEGWWLVTMLASLVVSVGSIVVRWRRSDTDLRQQMKWPLLGFVLVAAVVVVDLVAIFLVEVVGIATGLEGLVELAVAAVTLAFAILLGLGVLRFRLYDVDRVINRTIVYALLTGVVLGVYVLGVVGVGQLVPGTNEQGLALGTTVLVAVAFDPLRRRVQAAANRWMFGQRDDPYLVLSHLGGVMAQAGTPSETLQSVVDTVGEALKLPWVAVELDQRDGPVVRFEHGPTDSSPTAPVSLPLVHRDQVVGHLLAAPRSAREPLGAADRRLLAGVAHQAGAVAATARLTEDLQRSREELVLAREAERRRIRRDLHDGLGPTLAAQTLALDAAADRVGEDPAGAHELVVALEHDTRELVDEIRRLVHELRPPALDELGLAGALVAQVASLDAHGDVAVRIRSRPDPLPDLPAAVEVAGFRIVREAMTNVLRHAEATRCTISLVARAEALEVRIVDDGVGLPVVPRAGVGLASMRERAEELGGTFHATDHDGGGTEVVAVLPTGATPWDLGGTRITASRDAGAHQ